MTFWPTRIRLRWRRRSRCCSTTEDETDDDDDGAADDDFTGPMPGGGPVFAVRFGFDFELNGTAQAFVGAVDFPPPLIFEALASALTKRDERTKDRMHECTVCVCIVGGHGKLSKTDNLGSSVTDRLLAKTVIDCIAASASDRR